MEACSTRLISIYCHTSWFFVLTPVGCRPGPRGSLLRSRQRRWKCEPQYVGVESIRSHHHNARWVLHHHHRFARARRRQTKSAPWAMASWGLIKGCRHQKHHEVLRVWPGCRVAENRRRCDLRFCKRQSPSTWLFALTLNTSCTFCARGANVHLLWVK